MNDVIDNICINNNFVGNGGLRRDGFDIKSIINVCFLTATSPITISQIASILTDDNMQITQEQIQDTINELSTDYNNLGMELVKLQNGYKVRTQVRYQKYLNKIHKITPTKYSKAIMETLAIIAYKQPITRGEIEKLRGVSVNGNAIQTLLEREWIDVVGTKDIPGRPELLGTTVKFLEDFCISSIDELPDISNSPSMEPIIMQSVV